MATNSETKETKTRTAQDREIAAMSKISRLLAELSDDERARVVTWIARKFGPECKVVQPAEASAVVKR